LKWRPHRSLSKVDMDYLAGTPLMEKLQRHRLVIIYDPGDTHAKMEDLGLNKTKGMVYAREIQEEHRGSDTIEILFELRSDMEFTEQCLTLFKLNQN